jgi:hypothetical protein
MISPKALKRFIGYPVDITLSGEEFPDSEDCAYVIIEITETELICHRRYYKESEPEENKRYCRTVFSLKDVQRVEDFETELSFDKEFTCNQCGDRTSTVENLMYYWKGHPICVPCMANRVGAVSEVVVQ